jgi:hypothetical protein
MLVSMQASKTLNDQTLGPQVNNLITAFNDATNNLAATPVSSGSDSIMPTNDDISVIMADVLRQVLRNDVHSVQLVYATSPDCCLWK